MDPVVNEEVITDAAPATTEQDASDAIRRGYEKVAEPDKVQEQQTEAEPEVKAAEPAVQTEETPPANNDQLKELMARVERIPELEKRLRDEGGRYGALKQSLEQLQQKIAEATTTREVAANTADAKELMKDLRDEFPELADKLEGAFSKVMSSKGGIDQETLTKAVAEARAAEVKAETEALEAQLDEILPGWEQVTGSLARGIQGSAKFAEWIGTLPKREASRLSVSRDPFYIAEMIEKHNEWLANPDSKAKEKETAPAAPSKRLTDAVLPTTGQRVATQKAVDPKASIRAGYERVAGKRF